MMIQKIIAAAVIYLCFFFATNKALAVPPHNGQMLADELSLDDALRLLRNQSLYSRAFQAQIDVAAAERVAASVYLNPSLSYGGLALAHGANTGALWQHQIVIEQPLLLFGQRKARKNVANLYVRAEQARMNSNLEDRALAVRQVFATLLARQEQVHVLEESLKNLSQVEQIVRGRQQAGDRSVYDVMRLELELNALRIELQNTQTEVESASRQLASLLGFPEWRPRARGKLISERRFENFDQLWMIAQKQRPLLVAARAREALTRGGLTLARRERLPVPAIALGTQLTQQENSQSVFFGFSIPLPVFDRGQGSIARAVAEVQADVKTVEAMLAEARADLERAHAVYIQRQKTLYDIEQQMVIKIPRLRKMAEESYVGGNAGILELLDAFRTIKEIRLTYLVQCEAVKLAEISLISVSGLDPQSLNKKDI